MSQQQEDPIRRIGMRLDIRYRHEQASEVVCGKRHNRGREHGYYASGARQMSGEKALDPNVFRSALGAMAVHSVD